MKKKYINYYLETSGYGGTEKHLVHLIQDINDNEFVFRLILDMENPNAQHFKPFFQKLNELKDLKKIDAFEVFNKKKESTLEKIKKINGIIHFHRNGIEACAKAIMYSKFLGKKTVQTIHLAPGYHCPRIISRSEIRRSFYLLFADKVIAVSNSLRNECIQYYKTPKDKIVTIHNWVDVKMPSPDFDISIATKALSEEIGVGNLDDKVILICPARLDSQKGHQYLIEAISILKTENPNIYKSLIVLLAGTGSLEADLKKQSQRLNLNNIYFLGFRDDVIELLQISDAFILTSIGEGLPLSVLEAMTMKKPVLATAVDGTPEAVDDGKTGYLMKSKDPKNMSEVIQKFLFLSKEKREKMGREGYYKVKKQFDKEKQIEKVKKIYRILYN